MARISFDRDELNKIIQTLRMHVPHVFGNCDKIFGDKNVNEAKLISHKSTLLGKNSASFTDVVLSQAVLGSKEFRVALKMWFGWDAVSSNIKSVMQNYCNSLPKRCSDDEKKKILHSLLLPSVKPGVTTDELFNNAIEDLADAPNTESLQYEARVYSYITENIIMRNVSPNFIPILSASSCNISTMLPAFKGHAFKGSDRIVEKLEFIKSIFGDTVSLNFIITGSGVNMVKFRDLILSSVLSKQEAGDVLFQAMYALYVMDKYNIFHGDMHGENLFVQIMDNPVNMRFNINGGKVEISTKYVFKVYDFDRGYVDLLGDNSKSTYFIESGQDNKMRRNADFAHLICQCVQNESGISPKVFSLALDKIGLLKTAQLTYAAIPRNASEMGRCDNHSVLLSSKSSANVLSVISSFEVIKNTFSNDTFFRINPAHLSRLLTPTEYADLLSVFTPNYLTIVDKLLLRYEKVRGKVKLFTCQQWFCSQSNDINIDIKEYFETPGGIALVSSITTPPIPRKPFLEYTFLPPSPYVFVPQKELKDLYNASSAADASGHAKRQFKGKDAPVIDTDTPDKEDSIAKRLRRRPARIDVCNI